MSAKFVREVIGDWISRKHKEEWQSICGERKSKCFRKRQKSWRATPLEQKPAKNDDELLREHCHLT
jgi:hypothetical protein